VTEDTDQASDLDFAQTYLSLGTQYYDAGRYADAVDQFRAALEVNPYSDEAHALTGMSQYRLGKRDFAERSFRRALQLNPRNVLAQNGLALVSNDARERAVALESAINYSPDVPELRNNLCFTYVQSGDLDRAVTECEASLRLDSTNAYARYNLGNAYQRQGKFDQALAQYDAALRLQPEWARVLNNIGLVYYYRSELAKSVEFYQRAIAAEGSEAVFHYNVSLAYEAVASRLVNAEQRGESARAVYGVNGNSDWRTAYRQAAEELSTYLDLSPGVPDAARLRTKIADLRRRAG
jgi:Flp pilus assembly protein TadD